MTATRNGAGQALRPPGCQISGVHPRQVGPVNNHLGRDRSFVDVVINPGYVFPPRSPVRVPKKPFQRSFKPWVAPRTSNKSTWRIPSISTETLILGASNLSRITKSRLSHSSLSICSFPGAKFQPYYQLYQHVIPGADKVINLVLSFGLNKKDLIRFR